MTHEEQTAKKDTKALNECSCPCARHTGGCSVGHSSGGVKIRHYNERLKKWTEVWPTSK